MADGVHIANGHDGSEASCPFCQHVGSKVRSIHYAAGRKVESRECDECRFRFDADADFAITETEARGLSGERTGA